MAPSAHGRRQNRRPRPRAWVAHQRRSHAPPSKARRSTATAASMSAAGSCGPNVSGVRRSGGGRCSPELPSILLTAGTVVAILEGQVACWCVLPQGGPASYPAAAVHPHRGRRGRNGRPGLQRALAYIADGKISPLMGREDLCPDASIGLRHAAPHAGMLHAAPRRAKGPHVGQGTPRALGCSTQWESSARRAKR